MFLLCYRAKRKTPRESLRLVIGTLKTFIISARLGLLAFATQNYTVITMNFAIENYLACFGVLASI